MKIEIETKKTKYITFTTEDLITVLKNKYSMFDDTDNVSFYIDYNYSDIIDIDNDMPLRATIVTRKKEEIIENEN